MIDPKQLLEVAAQLAESPVRGAPRQAKLRRAISTAYYALFHYLITSAADLLAGASARGTQRYISIYRSFDHKRMAEVCKQVLSGRLLTDSGQQFHPDLQHCAAAFVELQENRHEADYDPVKRVALSDAKGSVSKSANAIKKLGQVPAEQRFLFLTLLHFKLRQ